MSLVVEDGTGLTNAESYISVVDATTYHASMGNAGWVGTQTQMEVALRQATQYLDTTYRFRGTTIKKNQPQQALMWPRFGVYFNNAYIQWPINRVIQATCEAALRALVSPGSLTVDQSDAQLLDVTVGPVSAKFQSYQQGGQVRFKVVDKLLAPFVNGTANTIRVERV